MTESLAGYAWIGRLVAFFRFLVSHISEKLDSTKKKNKPFWTILPATTKLTFV
jgi:hypothetical protein